MDPNKQADQPNSNDLPVPPPNQVISPDSQPNQPSAVDNINPTYQTEPPAASPAPVNPIESNSPADNQAYSSDRPSSTGIQPVIGNFTPDLPPPKNNKKKKIMIAAGAALIAVLSVVGFVFGYYIPNQPENVYRTGLDRSGDAIHELIINSTEPEKLEQIKKSEIDGSLEVTSDIVNLKGSLNAKLDPTKTNSSLDVIFKQKDQPEQKFGLKLLTELQDGKRFPNSYFQISGLRALQLDSFVPGFSDYDGKWIAVDADYLESLSSSFLPPEEKQNKENISAEEIAEVVRIISEVNNEYLFSTDSDKAVLENREYLGKEKTAEGVNAFHYKVGLNADNTVKYCKAMSDKVLSSRAAKKFLDADDKTIEEEKKSAREDCDKVRDEIKPDETFEMWVDAKYKVIHKIRIFSEKDKTDKYTDVGQIYTGGDKLSFFTQYHDDKDNLNVKFSLDLDIAQLVSKAEVKASQEGEDSFSGQGSITAKPYQGEINTEKPKDAIPISEILAKFGYDPSGQSGISASGNADIEKARRCAAAYEAQANNNGRGEIPAECE